jgi:hypothetical protein
MWTHSLQWQTWKNVGRFKERSLSQIATSMNATNSMFEKNPETQNI